jgi:hypothetical protein
MLVPDGSAIELPTNFLGIATLKYQVRDDGNHLVAVRTACRRIRDDVSRRRDEKLARREDLRTLWPLHLAIVSQDKESVERLQSELELYREIVKVLTVDRVADARTEMAKERIDGVIIDLFSETTTGALDLILHARDRRREIAFVLYGTRQQLLELPGVIGTWEETLQHYWRIPKDVSDETFRLILEDVILLLFIHKLTGGKFGDDPGSVAFSIMRPEIAGSWEAWHNV